MKKLVYFILGGFLLMGIIGVLFTSYIKKVISDPGKMGGSIMGAFGMSNVPAFKTGIFSDDGRYFAYTYTPEIEMPDVDASITIRGMGFPTYFQVMETATGKRMIDNPYKTGKSDQLYVVWTQDDLVWLMESVYHEGNRLALYDMKANKFRFEFGELEKLNSSVDWKSTSRFFINTSAQKGLLLEANDKRNYRMDPNTGKAETVQGKLEMVNYNYADNFQVSDLNGNKDFRKERLNGSRESITNEKGEAISPDDFIEVNFLTLSKNKKHAAYSDAPLTYYQNYFFVLSPISSDNKIDMELTMLDKTTLKTAWKLQLPQKELKTMIPKYGYERFYIKGDQLLVTNNDYLMTIDLGNGTIAAKSNLYE